MVSALIAQEKRQRRFLLLPGMVAAVGALIALHALNRPFDPWHLTYAPPLFLLILLRVAGWHLASTVEELCLEGSVRHSRILTYIDTTPKNEIAGLLNMAETEVATHSRQSLAWVIGAFIARELAKDLNLIRRRYFLPAFLILMAPVVLSLVATNQWKGQVACWLGGNGWTTC